MAASGSDELHQALIRDHFRRPRNRGPLADPACSGKAHNRFCGDTVIMWARVENGRLAEVTFDGRGCAISQAAASMLTAVAKGRTAESIARLRQIFVDGLAPDQDGARAAARAARAPKLPPELGDLRALVGVRRFPSRVRCAVLPFDALEDALRQRKPPG